MSSHFRFVHRLLGPDMVTTSGAIPTLFTEAAIPARPGSNEPTAVIHPFSASYRLRPLESASQMEEYSLAQSSPLVQVQTGPPGGRCR